MGDVRSKSQTIAVTVEDTAGSYKAPTAGSDYLRIQRDGAELTKSKNLIERDIYTGTLGKVSPRVGQTEAGGSLKVELTAADTEGAAPEYARLLKSALGSQRSAAAGTTQTGSTASVIKVVDASIYAVGDTVVIGKTHVSPITAVDTGDDEITLLVPMSAPPADGTEIKALTTFTVAESGHDSLSVTRYLEGDIRQYIYGTLVSGFSLEGFSVGSMPSLNFSLSAMNYDSSVHTQAHTPSLSSQLPPIILGATARMDGTIVHCQEISLSCENEITPKTSVNHENGILSNSVTARSFSGSFAPYMADDSVANYTKFKNNTPFSLFISAYLPGENAGEKKAVCSFYLPNCVATSIADADQDGLMVEQIEFSANRGAAGDKNEIYISFS